MRNSVKTDEKPVLALVLCACRDPLHTCTKTNTKNKKRAAEKLLRTIHGSLAKI